MTQRSITFVASELDIKRGTLIGNIVPYRNDALEIHPDAWNNPGLTADKLAKIIDADVKRFGWHIGSTNGGMVIAEPDYTTRRRVPPSSSLFHVAPKRLRHRIRRQGLIPSTGGRTHLKRRHPPRVYLALTLADAQAFIQNRIANWQRQGQPPSPTDFDIWRVRPGQRCYHDDLRFYGKGVWCTRGVPPTSIRLLFR